MTAKEFLELLASSIASRFPGNKAHLIGYAPALAKAIPEHWLSPEMAERIEDRMLDRMRLPELLSVIRAEGQTIPAPANSRGRPVTPATDEERTASRWLEYAQRRMDDRVPNMPPADPQHLLSLLRSQSISAWRSFAETHDPQALAQERRDQRELADRRAGVLPPLRSRTPDLRVIAGPPGRSGSQAPAEEARKVRPSYLTADQIAAYQASQS